MQRIFSVLLALLMLLNCSCVYASEMGVQQISGQEVDWPPASVEDLSLNTETEIENWGVFTATSFEIQDGVGYYRAGRTDVYSYNDIDWSGSDADFAVLYADILNTTFSDKDYLANVSVKVVYDEAYEFIGWSFQMNHDNSPYYDSKIKADKRKQNIRWHVDPSDQKAIMPMYAGHYIFGCTLPNAVINSLKPLRMLITIDGNEITYHIRK